MKHLFLTLLIFVEGALSLSAQPRIDSLTYYNPAVKTPPAFFEENAKNIDQFDGKEITLSSVYVLTTYYNSWGGDHFYIATKIYSYVEGKAVSDVSDRIFYVRDKKDSDRFNLCSTQEEALKKIKQTGCTGFDNNPFAFYVPESYVVSVKNSDGAKMVNIYRKNDNAYLIETFTSKK